MKERREKRRERLGETERERFRKREIRNMELITWIGAMMEAGKLFFIIFLKDKNEMGSFSHAITSNGVCCNLL